MKDGDFTVDNEIISCWIKRALSYLVKAGIVFIVAFIVLTIMTMETILTSNRLEGISMKTSISIADSRLNIEAKETN